MKDIANFISVGNQEFGRNNLSNLCLPVVPTDRYESSRFPDRDLLSHAFGLLALPFDLYFDRP